MKIEPGYYKVKGRGGFLGKQTSHYLRVYYKGKKKYLQFDHGLPTAAEDNEEDVIHGYTIIKKVTRPIEVNKLKVSVEWQDEDGDAFSMQARNSVTFDRIFKFFPRVFKAFKL